MLARRLAFFSPPLASLLLLAGAARSQPTPAAKNPAPLDAAPLSCSAEQLGASGPAATASGAVVAWQAGPPGSEDIYFSTLANE